MKDAIDKQELVDPIETSMINRTTDVPELNSVVEESIASNFYDPFGSGISDLREIKDQRIKDMNNNDEESSTKRPKIEAPEMPVPPPTVPILPPTVQICKEFWKAGDDYEVGDCGTTDPYYAFAELLDNSLDEVSYGATYVKVDVLSHTIYDKMFLVEDNGGGMNPEKLRQCMSSGYSEKLKKPNMIGQSGTGFETSTMRLGADVIVFSRCQGKNGLSPTQSIGMLSYTFLKETGKENIVVPIVDYDMRGGEWFATIKTSQNDWDTNLKTLVQWSPYYCEKDLIMQFDSLKVQGTRIVIYNLWEDEQGQLEFDFDTDSSDIQIRGVSRDEKNIEMAMNHPNLRHLLTFRHSLRSYASILYHSLPPGFQIILREINVDHHSLVDDMTASEKITYKPTADADGMPNGSNMVADGTIGYLKAAYDHLDIQGFNIYHKNKLIKPFWRLSPTAGSDCRGLIGTISLENIPCPPPTNLYSWLEAQLLQTLQSL